MVAAGDERDGRGVSAEHRVQQQGFAGDADEHGAVPKPNEARLVVLQKGCPIGGLAGQRRGRGVFGRIEGHGFEPAQHGFDATLHGLLRRGYVEFLADGMVVVAGGADGIAHGCVVG